MARENGKNVSGKASGVFLVDDHAIVRHGLAAIIEQEDDLFVCGEADNAEDALRTLKSARPEICLVDLSLTGMDGLELVKRIKVSFPGLPVLVLSMYDENLYAERALKAGAKGYIMKREGLEAVLAAIRRVLEGDIHLSENLAARILRRLFDGGAPAAASPVESLTDRELQVYRLIGAGLGTREIAKRLHVSVKTVDSHRAGIMKKLGLGKGTELVHHAIQWVASAENG